MVPETLKYGAFSCMASAWRTDDCTPLIDRAMSQSGAYDQAIQIIYVERGRQVASL